MATEQSLWLSLPAWCKPPREPPQQPPSVETVQMRATDTSVGGESNVRGMSYVVESLFDSPAAPVGFVLFLGLGVIVVLFVIFFRG